MALFKILRGTASSINKNNANKPPFVDGYAYFTPDDGRFYIDVQLDSAPSHYYDSGVVNGKNIYRIEIESGTWAELNNVKKDVQSAVSDPAASDTSTSFISNISQNADGVISPTKKNLPTASTSAAGIIQIGTGATNAAAGNHAHGNIANGGTIGSTGVALANGDYLLFSDASNSGKIERTSITFDGSTATKALTQKGTWETFNNYSHPTGDGNLHVPANGTSNNGNFLQATGTAGTYQWASVTKSTVGLGNVTNDAQIPKSIGQAAGDIIYFSSANTPVRLAKGTDGQVLKLASGLPTWSTDNNTLNTAGSTDTSSKIFLVGATSQAANPQTYSDNQVYATNGQLDANKVRVAEAVTLQYNTTTKSLDFIFA